MIEGYTQQPTAYGYSTISYKSYSTLKSEIHSKPVKCTIKTTEEVIAAFKAEYPSGEYSFILGNKKVIVRFYEASSYTNCNEEIEMGSPEIHVWTELIKTIKDNKLISVAGFKPFNLGISVIKGITCYTYCNKRYINPRLDATGAFCMEALTGKGSLRFSNKEVAAACWSVTKEYEVDCAIEDMLS